MLRRLAYVELTCASCWASQTWQGDELEVAERVMAAHVGELLVTELGVYEPSGMLSVWRNQRLVGLIA